MDKNSINHPLIPRIYGNPRQPNKCLLCPSWKNRKNLSKEKLPAFSTNYQPYVKCSSVITTNNSTTTIPPNPFTNNKEEEEIKNPRFYSSLKKITEKRKKKKKKIREKLKVTANKGRLGKGINRQSQKGGNYIQLKIYIMIHPRLSVSTPSLVFFKIKHGIKSRRENKEIFWWPFGG